MIVLLWSLVVLLLSGVGAVLLIARPEGRQYHWRFRFLARVRCSPADHVSRAYNWRPAIRKLCLGLGPWTLRHRD